MAGFSVVTYAICEKSTRKAISEAIEGLSEGMSFKGSVATLNDLPSNPEDGDLYIVEENKSKVVFFDDKWVEFDHEINLIAGEGIVINLDSEGNTVISSTEKVINYEDLDNLPSINGVTLIGDKDASEFNIQDKFNAGSNVYFYNDSNGDLYLNSTIDYNELLLELPNALKQLLSEQVTPSGLLVDSEGNISLDVNEEYFEIGQDNKLTLKQWLILDANDDPAPGSEPIVGEAVVGSAIVAPDNVATVDNAIVDNAVVGDENIATVDNATVDNAIVGDDSGTALYLI